MSDPVPATPDEELGGQRCPLCETPLLEADVRCPECGMHLAGVGGRPGAYSRLALWWTVAGFVAVYVVVLAVVALTR